MSLVQAEDLNQGVRFSTAVHSDHCVLSLATPAFVRRAKLFSYLYGLTVAQVCRRLGYDGVPDRHTRDDFPIGTAIAPEGHGAALGLVVFQQEDDAFAILVMHCARRNQNGHGVRASVGLL